MGPSEDVVQKCAEYLAGWKRALADYDNLKKDLVKDKQLMRWSIYEEFALKIVPVFDLFGEAMKYIPPDPNHSAANVLKGMSMACSYLEQQLRSLGIEPFDDRGKFFDPHQHESAGSRIDPAQPELAILEVVARGWKLGDKVIRPARVIINQK
jgi:molecular chaperone GrpE